MPLAQASLAAASCKTDVVPVEAPPPKAAAPAAKR
jgi:hypothetical protein